MDNMRNDQENGSHWIQFMFFERSSVTIHLLKWFGLGSSSPSSSFSSHSEEEDVVERKEEEDDMTIDITERRLKKSRSKPKSSSGKGGKVH
ncbi:Elicitor peptide 3 [Hirschfeldia incana]|nr:Elicitor peptide 3 [Hirschfeldia incana]